MLRNGNVISKGKIVFCFGGRDNPGDGGSYVGQRDQKHHSLHCARRCMLALQVWIMVLKSRTGSPPGRYVSNCPYDIVISKASGKGRRKKKTPRKHNQKTTPTEKDKTSYFICQTETLPTPPQLRTRIRQARPFLSPHPFSHAGAQVEA